MNSPTNDKRFHVVAPARAYSVLIGVSALLLAIGLLLPLTLASSASTNTSGGNHPGQPIDVQSGAAGPSVKTTSAAGQIPNLAQGVTSSSIKVGVILLDLSSVAPLGLGLPNYGIDIQKAAYESLFAEINSKGGIGGRKIVPIYESRDTLASTGPHSDKAICLSLAKDQKVFAVIGMTYDAGNCAALQYHLPVVTKNASVSQVYRESHGLLVTLDPALERDGVDWARVLVKSGLVTGHKFGMVTMADGGTIQLPAEAAADELKSLGHPLAVLGELDPSNSIADIPALIQKMKAANVDSVMLAPDFADALRFIALAEAQNYFPQYLTSDLQSLASDGLLANAGKSFNNAIGFTDSYATAGTETPQAQACRENYNKTTSTADIAPGVQSPLGIVCSVVDVFQRAVDKAGKDLNSRTFIQAVESLGAVGDISAVRPGRFAPGKTDYSDTLQPVRWSSATKSYSNNGAPITVN